MQYYARFFQGIQQDFKLFFFWCLIFTLFRWLFIGAFTSQLPDDTASNLVFATWLGLRLSLKTCGIITILSWLIATLPYIISKHWPHMKARFTVHSLALIFFSICAIARIPYYRIFNQAYNLMLVNGIHDDKMAILDTAIKEYDLLYRLPMALLMAAVLISALSCYIKHVPSFSFEKIAYKKTVMVLTLPFLVIFWVFCRYGGAFSYADSINWESCGRTKSNLLNEAILDDGQALYRTWALKKQMDNINNVDITVSELKKRIEKAGGNSKAKTIDEAFLRTVGQPKIAHKPKNIVLIAGESFGIWPMLPKFKDLNLTPETMSIMTSDHTTNIDTMLAHGSGTVFTFNGLLTGLPDASLYENYQPESFKSKYQSGIGYIMKQLGYKTAFWYGGFATWEGSKRFAEAQSFDEYHCADEIKYENGTSWGCPDADLFKAVEEYLAKQTEKPFCLILTTTNHPPYTIDLKKEGFPAEQIKKKLPVDIDNTDEMLNELGHIWYADKAMGQFVKRMEKRESDSLFIITGDHSERFTFAKQQDTRTLSAIPCIFYGRDMKPDLFTKNSVGSHMQLAGTLAEMYGKPGMKYSAYMPNMFTEKTVWNHRLMAEGSDISILNKNKQVNEQANNLR